MLSLPMYYLLTYLNISTLTSGSSRGSIIDPRVGLKLGVDDGIDVVVGLALGGKTNVYPA